MCTLVMTYFKINMSSDEKFTKYGTELNFILIIFIKARVYVNILNIN